MKRRREQRKRGDEDDRDDEQYMENDPDLLNPTPGEEIDAAEDAEQGLVARRGKRGAKRGRVRPK